MKPHGLCLTCCFFQVTKFNAICARIGIPNSGTDMVSWVHPLDECDRPPTGSWPPSTPCPPPHHPQHSASLLCSSCSTFLLACNVWLLLQDKVVESVRRVADETAYLGLSKQTLSMPLWLARVGFPHIAHALENKCVRVAVCACDRLRVYLSRAHTDTHTLTCTLLHTHTHTYTRVPTPTQCRQPTPSPCLLLHTHPSPF